MVFESTVNAQTRRRTRIRTNPIQRQQIEPQEQEDETEANENDNTPEPAIQYYSATQDDNQQQDRVVLVADDEEYKAYYARPTPRPQGRADYNRHIAKSTTVAPRTKDSGSKAPTVQTIRNYSKVNDDGSFTFGYEAADGSFKEETRGTDCVVRGKYGYIDPDGNKREFTYVSGNPCDPNNPDPNDDDEASKEAEEDNNEPENVPANFPRRPIVSRPAPRPVQTTTHAPTTVFQNQYTSNQYAAEESEEEDEDDRPNQLQILHQPQNTRIIARPQSIPNEVSIQQRPRITINTTPTPLYQLQTQAVNSISITPRPTYRVPSPSAQTQLPATTYRPSIQFFTQKAAQLPNKATQSHLAVEPITKTAYSSTKKPVDFAAELQKFHQEHNAITTTTPRGSNLKTFRPIPKLEIPNTTPNPIYETQLVFDPATGQYDASLFPQLAQLPQPNPSYQLNHHIQGNYLQQQQQQPFRPLPQLVSLEQLQQQNGQPIYQRPAAIQTTRAPAQFPQFSQQVYQKDQENLQVLNSQQLYAQQQEIQQAQLHQDRIEAAKRHQQHQQHHQQQQQQSHRFQLGQQVLRPLQAQPQAQPNFFYVQQPQQFDF